MKLNSEIEDNFDYISPNTNVSDVVSLWSILNWFRQTTITELITIQISSAKQRTSQILIIGNLRKRNCMWGWFKSKSSVNYSLTISRT